MDPTTRDNLLAAGWHPGRAVTDQVEAWRRILDAPGGFQIFEAARAALIEFGGLKVKARGPGIDVARSSFHLDPTLAVGEEERFSHARMARARGSIRLGKSRAAMLSWRSPKGATSSF